MGEIEEGTVSGSLPSATTFAVHIPAYPSSITRAVETLGGIDKIEKVRASESNKMEFHFRPEDPYAHPAFGQRYSCKNLLLKISKKKVDSASEPAVSSTIVAQVQEAYHFNGMVDYQHVVAVHADVARRKRTWTETEPSDPDAVDENLMILAPPLFSPKDIPENLVLKPSISLSSKKKLEGVVQHRWEMGIEPCLAIDFNIKEVPRTVNWKAHIFPTSSHWKPQEALSKLFDERPIWTRASIVQQLDSLGFKIGDNLLKRLLFRVAYYFGSGPFHRFWIKKGYDPRKDPESRVYQRIDFRIPPDLRNHCDASAGIKQRWEDICSFRVFPSKYHLYLQLCELSDEFIQEEIKKPPKQTVCTPTTGWFTSSVLLALRLRIAVRFLSVSPLPGAEEILKSYTDRFEKSKKIRYQAPNTKSSDEVSQIDEEAAGGEDKDAAIEEDEDEIEEDDVEEDMYDYYPSHMDAEDAGFPHLADTNPDGENMSKNYLQELFGSFPLDAGEGGTGLSNAESDEEFHIFEHETDQSSDEYN